MKKKHLQILLIIILFIIVDCKNPFATREPEPPSGNKSSWRLPTDPLIVLENMKSAFREKNVENYMKCLVDSNNVFRFLPNEYEAANNAGIFEQWNLSCEQGYINKLFTSIPDDSICTFSFSNYKPNVLSDSVLVNIDYTLELHHILVTGYPRHSKGKAEFCFKTRDGYWVITRWQDYETIVDNSSVRLPSWSTIKASFTN